jgi:formate-dependent nitrite reductase membrane component NrfD
MQVLFGNPATVFWLAVAFMSVVPMLCTFWYKAKKAEMDAQLKATMLEMGMSAADIERVLAAESGHSQKNKHAVGTHEA